MTRVSPGDSGQSPAIFSDLPSRDQRRCGGIAKFAGQQTWSRFSADPGGKSPVLCGAQKSPGHGWTVAGQGFRRQREKALESQVSAAYRGGEEFRGHGGILARSRCRYRVRL